MDPRLCGDTRGDDGVDPCPAWRDDGVDPCPAWRAGVDLTPDDTTLAKSLAELMSYQLEKHSLAVSEKAGVRYLVSRKHLREGDIITDAPCLVYSAIPSLRYFLNQGGNSALVEGPPIQVDGVLRPDGEPKTLYCVLLGAAQLAADYRGVRKHPNAIIEARPELGPNDGLLRLAVKTHNGCGIAEGNPIVIDCGPKYVPCKAPATSPMKRFKGALDIIWDKHRAGQENPSQASPAPALPGPPAPATAAAAPGAPAAPVPAAAPPAAEGAGAQAAPSPSPQPQPQPQPQPEPQQPGPANAAATALPSLQPGEQRLGTTSVVDIFLTSAFTLQLRLLGGQNKKIPGNTCLYAFEGGRVDPKTATTSSSFPWEFKTGQELVAKRNGDAVKLTKLLTYIKDNKIGAVFGHNAFTEGVCPPELVLKKALVFSATSPTLASTFQKVHAALTGSANAHLVWEITHKEGKIWPKSLVIMTKKQLSLKAGENFQL